MVLLLQQNYSVTGSSSNTCSLCFASDTGRSNFTLHDSVDPNQTFIAQAKKKKCCVSGSPTDRKFLAPTQDFFFFFYYVQGVSSVAKTLFITVYYDRFSHFW